MSYFAPQPSAPPPQMRSGDRPPPYNPYSGPSSYNYGAVDHNAYQPQPQHYQQHYNQPTAPPVYSNNTTTTVTRTQATVPNYRPPKPSTHLGLGIFTMLCCCFICGLIAIIVGLEVDNAYNSGDDIRARRKSKQALGFSIAALGFGIVIHLSWVAVAIYLIAILAAATSTTSPYN